MSYFIAISGASAGSLVPVRGKLVPAYAAQPYFQQFEAEIARASGGTVFLWDDSESDTSDDLVCEACDEIQLHGKRVSESAFASMLSSCAESGSCLYVWWPSRVEGPGDLSLLPIAQSAPESLQLFVAQASSGGPVGFALLPNYVSKPTAESSSHSSNAIVRGGLTRR